MTFLIVLAALTAAAAVSLALGLRRPDPACVLCKAETLDACTCLRQYRRR